MSVNYVGKAELIYFATAEKNKMDATYVAKEANKGLSSNDYTTDEKNKLDGIEPNAEVNVQPDWDETDPTSKAYIANKPTIPTKFDTDDQMSDTSENPIQNKVVKKYIDDKTSSIYKPMGSITFENLPTSGMAVGHVYNITNDFTTTADFEDGAGKKYPAGTNVVYTENSKWDALSGLVDLSGYVKTDDIEALTTTEIDTIVNGVWG